MVRKQGNEITGINRRGLVVAIPEPIRHAIEEIPFDLLIDGEVVAPLHAFDLLEVKGNDLRHRRYIDRHAGQLMIIPPKPPDYPPVPFGTASHEASPIAGHSPPQASVTPRVQRSAARRVGRGCRAFWLTVNGPPRRPA